MPNFVQLIDKRDAKAKKYSILDNAEDIRVGCLCKTIRICGTVCDETVCTPR